MKETVRRKSSRARTAAKKAVPGKKAAKKARRKTLKKAPRRKAAPAKAPRKKAAPAKAPRRKAAPGGKAPRRKAAPAKAPGKKAAAAPRRKAAVGKAAPGAAAQKSAPAEVSVQWQAHRGGGGFERPDNTMVSFLYGWDLGGIAEADVRQTRDGRIVCLHDATLARTTDAPADIAGIPVTELNYAQFTGVDAGVKFARQYAGQRVPLLEDVLARMAEVAARRMYLDLKRIDLDALAGMIHRFGLEGRIYVAAPKIEECEGLKERLPGVGTLLWCGGTDLEIHAKFRSMAAAGFYRLDQIQLHLNDEQQAVGWRYQIKPAFIAEALAVCAARGVDLEVLPWKFEPRDIEALLDLGVRWYATDEPRRFLDAVQGWKAAQPQRAHG